MPFSVARFGSVGASHDLYSLFLASTNVHSSDSMTPVLGIYPTMAFSVALGRIAAEALDSSGWK